MLRWHCVVSKSHTLCSLLGKLCHSRIKRLSWGFRGNNPFFCSEIPINLGLQLCFQNLALYTRLVRSTLGYSVYMKHSVNFTQHQVTLRALGFGASWCPLTTALSPIVGSCPALIPALCATPVQRQNGAACEALTCSKYVFMPVFRLSMLNVHGDTIPGVCPTHPLPGSNLSCHSFMVYTDAVCLPWWFSRCFSCPSSPLLQGSFYGRQRPYGPSPGNSRLLSARPEDAQGYLLILWWQWERDESKIRLCTQPQNHSGCPS